MKNVKRLAEWNSMGPRWDLIQPGIAPSGAAADDDADADDAEENRFDLIFCETNQASETSRNR